MDPYSKLDASVFYRDSGRTPEGAKDPFDPGERFVRRQSSQRWELLQLPNEQLGHWTVPPQPSGPLPHCQPSDPHVAFWHEHVCVVLLHVFGDEQPPQSRGWPQLSVPVPHCQPSWGQLFGVHPHLFAAPFAPQT
jgi:hypothetical protein